MAVKADPTQACPWRSFRNWAKCQAIAFLLSMGKNRLRAATALVLMVFWMGWTIALATGAVSPAPGYQTLLLAVYGGTTLVMGTILGKIWGYELDKIADMASSGIEIKLTASEGDDDQ